MSDGMTKDEALGWAIAWLTQADVHDVSIRFDGDTMHLKATKVVLAESNVVNISIATATCTEHNPCP